MKQFGKQNSAQIKIITAMVIFGTIGIVRKNIALSSSVVACAIGTMSPKIMTPATMETEYCTLAVS